jgi:hypothetical protein
LSITEATSLGIGEEPQPVRFNRLNGSSARHFIRRTTLVVGAWLIGAAVFFYGQWSSGFNRVMGDVGDARLITYLNEQWFLVLRGVQPWRSPPFFYPTKGLLGYSDSFFLFQMVFAPVRALGADPFLALQLTVIILSFMAFVCFVIFATVAFRAPLLVALVGALVFTFANNLSGHAGSFQLFGIYFVPTIALIALYCWRLRSTRPAVSIALGAAAGLLSGLLLFSTYYVAWFSLLVSGIVAVLVIGFGPRTAVVDLRSAATVGWRSLFAVLVGFFVGIIPFLLTYLPVEHEQAPRQYADALLYSLSWHDVDNVGTGSLLWGHLVHLSWSTTVADPYELSYAISPILFLTVVAGGIAIATGSVTRRLRLTPRLRLTLALCCTTVILALLPIETRFGSAWVVVWHIPGATAIRAIDRIQIVSDLVTSLALVLLGTEAVARWKRLQRSLPLRVAAIALLCLIVVEQAHDTSSSTLQRSTELAALDAVPPAPSGCTSFFVTDTHPNQIPYYQFQTTAMLISQRIGIPTLNGYSGDQPKGWGLVSPDSTSYSAAVQEWTTANGLTTGVCNFDLGTYSWHTGLNPQVGATAP